VGDILDPVVDCWVRVDRVGCFYYNEVHDEKEKGIEDQAGKYGANLEW